MSDNKRIAKNTLLLYLRMFLLMAINLFTSRVILATLGVSDYGIYNVVGGVVAMFGLFSGAIINSVSRFLTVELGKGDFIQLGKVFSTSLNVMFVLSLIIIIMGETVGLCFLNCKMNIPEERMCAANWVFQCSLLTFVLNLISIPYTSMIVSHEKMSAFAYISIFEALMKLLIVYVLYVSPFDTLKSYALLLLVLSFAIRFMYGRYCKKNFEEATYHYVNDKLLLKQMISFAGWDFLGHGAFMINNAGVNIVINLFFGITVNAARGIAVQVNNALTQFGTNFMMAFNPQITKKCAAGNMEEMHQLIYQGAKFSYFLMLFLLIPICLKTREILQLWLNIVPDYAVEFVRWTLIISTMRMSSNTLITGLHATGNIKKFMIIVGMLDVANFPITYIAFKLGNNPIYAYYVYFFVSFVLMFLKLYLIKDLINMRAMDFVKNVYIKVSAVTIIAIIPSYILSKILPDTLYGLICICIFSFVFSALSICYVGLNRSERTKVISIVRHRLNL